MTIDIIVPVKDAEETLPACLESMAQQTIRDSFQLIAVDDHSTDGSRKLLETFAGQHPGTQVISSPGNGIVDALNTGIAHSTAPLIARMDADDVMRPERLEKQLDYLNRHTDISVAGCLVDEHGFDGGFEHYVSWSNGLTTPNEIATARFIESPIVHPTVMFRRELVEQHGGYRNGAFPEDYELWLRWMDAGVRFGKVDETLLTWADKPDRLTRTDPRYSAEAFFETKADYLAKWLTRNNPQGNRVWIWGAGANTRKRIRRLAEHGIIIDGWVDIDPDKIGTQTKDGTISAPDDLPGPESSFVLSAVGSRGARELIAADLAKRGYVEGRSFLCIA